MLLFPLVGSQEKKIYVGSCLQPTFFYIRKFFFFFLMEKWGARAFVVVNDVCFFHFSIIFCTFPFAFRGKTHRRLVLIEGYWIIVGMSTIMAL